MDRNKIDLLIAQLVAIKNFAKDIHYNCSGENFYGQHLFADRISGNNGDDDNATDLSEYVDQLKEVCLLGHGFKTLPSKQYLKMAIDLIPDNISFEVMRTLLIETLAHIESITGISKGDENLIGAIAQDLQNNLGLINIMYGDYENV